MGDDTTPKESGGDTPMETLGGFILFGLIIWAVYAYFSSDSKFDCLNTMYEAGATYELASKSCKIEK